MASFTRWKNSPCKPGIPEFTYDDHIRMISKKKWSGNTSLPSRSLKNADAKISIAKDNDRSNSESKLRYQRPNWLHHAIRYERDPFTRAFAYFYEGRTTIDERVAKVWSTEAHKHAEKRARVRREHRAHLKRSHGHADLGYPHGIPNGPALDPRWQRPSSLQYTPASGTSTTGANVLSRVTANNVDAMLQRIGIGKKNDFRVEQDLNPRGKEIIFTSNDNKIAYRTNYKESLKTLKSGSKKYKSTLSNNLHISDLNDNRATSIIPKEDAKNNLALSADKKIIEKTIINNTDNDQSLEMVDDQLSGTGQMVPLPIITTNFEVKKINELETKIKNLEIKLELEKKQHMKEIEDLKIEFRNKLDKT